MNHHLREARQPVDERAPHLRVDPLACAGVGVCAHFAPDLVSVDSWGYPVVADIPLTHKADRRQAEAAARACPRRALHLT